MKININGYDVRISAKNRFSNRYNEEDTAYFLNLLSMWISEAQENYAEKGYKSLSEDTEKASNDIYETLKKIGFYDIAG